MNDIHLVNVSSGAMALTHRPKLKDFSAFRASGITHIITLLAENEGARQLGDAAMRAGLGWIWVPFEGASVPDTARSNELRPVLQQLCGLLAADTKLLIHCSAGIHRTGMFGYALLRQLGLNADEFRAKLAELRQVTAEGVGADRLAWGDALAQMRPDESKPTLSPPS